jgi:carbon-monoxide dehydrogenase medium subunit
MKPVAFDYIRPSDISAAIKALGSANGEGKIIAGGQSLGPMLNLRLARPRLLVDIATIPQLRTVEDNGAFWRIGAATTHAEIEDCLTPIGSTALLPTVARGIAYRAVRNRGTVGGSLAHADPAADWPLALSALDARVNIEGPDGNRQIAVLNLMIAAFTTALADDEIIVSVDVPKMSSSARWGYFKFCRKVGVFPSASAAVVVDAERNVSRILLGALGGAPRLLERLSGDVGQRGLGEASLSALDESVVDAAPELDALDRRIFTACLARAIEQAGGR